MIILNLGSGTQTSPELEVINIDWSIALRVRRNYLLRAIAPIVMRGGRMMRFKKLPDNIKVWDLSRGIPFDSDTIDAVYHSHMLEHLDRDVAHQFMLECKRELKPGGRLVLQTPNADSPQGMSIHHGDVTHEVGFNPNVLSRLLSLTGFQRIVSRETGPIPIGHSVKFTICYLIWQGIRASLKLWNLAETGGAGSGVFTRVFLITAEKRV